MTSLIRNTLVRRAYLHHTYRPVSSSANQGRKNAVIIEETNELKYKDVAIDVKPPRGSRDFYPEDHRLKDWLFEKWRSSARVFGFEEYDAPIVENEALYIRKAGEEISQQLYNFEDKGGRRLSLRPEMTPSLARMVMAKRSNLTLPLKWFSIPQCWRYERMSRGRRREHYQWNMDIWGVRGVEAESELLGAVVHSLSAMGLGPQDVGIKINSRKLMTAMMRHCGIPDEIHAVACVVLDKIDKLPLDRLETELADIGVDAESVGAMLQLVQIKSISELRDAIGECEGLSDLDRLQTLALQYGYSDWLVFDPSVVRGLAYYTGVVFECFDRQGELRAICGGGRYDTLLDTFSPRDSAGANSISAVGFGFGDAVIIELLRLKGCLPDFTTQRLVDVVIGATEKEYYGKAVAYACELRRKGISVDVIMEPKRLKAILQRGDKLNTGFTIVLAPTEAKNSSVLMKQMSDGVQWVIEESMVVDTVVKKVQS